MLEKNFIREFTFAVEGSAFVCVIRVETDKSVIDRGFLAVIERVTSDR